VYWQLTHVLGLTQERGELLLLLLLVMQLLTQQLYLAALHA
jgi:hypothetical protein